MFGNLSKMFGGGFGGLLSGIIIPNLVIPTFAGGDVAGNCAQALSQAVGNWSGTVASGMTAAVLGAAVTYVFPKNQKKY